MISQIVFFVSLYIIWWFEQFHTLISHTVPFQRAVKEQLLYVLSLTAGCCDIQLKCAAEQSDNIFCIIQTSAAHAMVFHVDCFGPLLHYVNVATILDKTTSQ